MKLGINGRFYAARLSGVQRFARELCSELYQRGDTVLLVPADAELPSMPASVRVIRGSTRGQIWEQLELPRLANAEKVHALLHPANTLPRTGRNHAVVVHDVLPLTHPHWFSRRYVWWHRHVIRPAVARARAVFTCSAWSAREIARTCAVAPNRIRRITQGLAPFDAPASVDTVAHTLARFGIGGPYVLCVGWSDPRKNIGLVVAAIAELRRDHPDLILVTVGNANARVHGRQPHYSAEWIKTLGNVDDDALRALYTGSRALCFPSLAEGFGRPPLEALACGTPALVGDYEAAHEVFGEAVPILRQDAAAWTARLRALLDYPEQRAQLVQRAAPLLSSLHWSRAADQIVVALEHGSSRRPEVFA